MKVIIGFFLLTMLLFSSSEAIARGGSNGFGAAAGYLVVSPLYSMFDDNSPHRQSVSSQEQETKGLVLVGCILGALALLILGIVGIFLGLDPHFHDQLAVDRIWKISIGDCLQFCACLFVAGTGFAVAFS